MAGSSNRPSPSTPSSTPSATTATSEGGLSGKWKGQYSGTYNGSFVLDWTQSGSGLSGTITLSSPPGTLSLHGYSYVPGVRISGEVKSGHVTLEIGGSAAAEGTLHDGPRESLVGELGGEAINLSAHQRVTLARYARSSRRLVAAERAAARALGPVDALL